MFRQFSQHAKCPESCKMQKMRHTKKREAVQK